MEIVQTSTFRRQVKKISSSHKKYLDEVIRKLVESPLLGQRKKGDLKEVFVYKFKVGVHLLLLAYSLQEDKLILLAIGSHENFYRDLKN